MIREKTLETTIGGLGFKGLGVGDLGLALSRGLGLRV